MVLVTISPEVARHRSRPTIRPRRSKVFRIGSTPDPASIINRLPRSDGHQHVGRRIFFCSRRSLACEPERCRMVRRSRPAAVFADRVVGSRRRDPAGDRFDHGRGPYLAYAPRKETGGWGTAPVDALRCFGGAFGASFAPRQPFRFVAHEQVRSSAEDGRRGVRYHAAHPRPRSEQRSAAVAFENGPIKQPGSSDRAGRVWQTAPGNDPCPRSPGPPGSRRQASRAKGPRRPSPRPRRRSREAARRAPGARFV